MHNLKVLCDMFSIKIYEQNKDHLKETFLDKIDKLQTKYKDNFKKYFEEYCKIKVRKPLNKTDDGKLKENLTEFKELLVVLLPVEPQLAVAQAPTTPPTTGGSRSSKTTNSVTGNDIKDYISLLTALIKAEDYKALLHQLQTEYMNREYKILYYFKHLSKNVSKQHKNEPYMRIYRAYNKLVSNILELFNLRLTKRSHSLNIDLYHYLLVTKLNGKSYKFFQSPRLNELLTKKKRYIRRFYAKYIEEKDNLKDSFYYKLMQYINKIPENEEEYMKYSNYRKKREVKSFVMNVVEDIEDKKQKDTYIVGLVGECVLPSMEFYGKI